MLNRLIIRNIALIEALEVELADGLNVLSGETGAGKSIIVDSLNLVLGERADREMIRTGAGKAVVEAWFSDVPDSVNAILDAQQIEREDDLVLSRELSAEGRNVCRINGVLVTLAVLKSISDALVDIHGQHEHQSLLHEKNHIAILDSFDERIAAAAEQTAAAYDGYTAVTKRLRALFGSDGDRERRIDILRFQIDEILSANITQGEADDLMAQRKRMNAAEQIASALGAAYDALYDAESGSVLASLKDMDHRISGISDIDPKYAEIAQQVSDAYFTLEETASAIRTEMDACVFDADELEEIEDRLALIRSLERKYQDPTTGGAFITRAQQELADLEDSEALLEQLTAKADALKAELYEKSVHLSQLRRSAAESFAQMVMQQLHDLGMASADFSVRFADMPDISAAAFSRGGIDTVAFYISTNRGEPQKPLKKVASGGEVSRIMLALKNIAAGQGGIPTMVFDEIDTGISGRMAQVVAEKLFRIARGRQVICVTHLPQIASMADCHFLVQKHSDNAHTLTTLEILRDEARIAEVARLSGGDSGISKEHARHMIENAEIFKTTI